MDKNLKIKELQESYTTDKWDFYNTEYCKVCQNVLKEKPVKSHPAAAVQHHS